jgi:serine/threonine protein kinase
MIVPETEIIITSEGQELLRRVLRPGEYTLGRSPACDICIPSGTVSRKQAKLTVNFSSLFLEDLGSFNGTTVNGGPITGKTQIWHGQQIQMGYVCVELRKICADPMLGGSLAPAQEAVVDSLPEDVTFQHSGYQIGHLIGRGGMGAVLQATDASIQRDVAMKVVLRGDSPRDILRFIHEARVTGQLEHPNIIPVHALGADEHGQPFYTMKLVRGATLKQVLNDLARGDEDAIRNYTLPSLLNIFQKVCDAIRFAHSQQIVHRDLKPDNIMIGNFGEVLVMDWGLAKSLVPRDLSPDQAEATDEEASAADIDYRNESHTLTGAVLGTPQYMPPEQALGNSDAITEKADVYSLGAILYHILCLRPPVESGTAEQVLDRVIRGEIITPSNASSKSSKSSTENETLTERIPIADVQDPPTGHLPHLPAGRIPASLEAMVLKAMSHDPENRYPSVDDLQKDLNAYKSGFATKAEHAGLLKLVTLWVKRNRTISAAVACVLLLTVGFAASLAREVDRSAQSLARLSKAAPTLVERAWSHLDEGRFEDALEKVSFAVDVDPSNADYLLLQARLLQSLGRIHDSSDVFKRVTQLRKDLVAAENIEVCARLTRLFLTEEELSIAGKAALLNALYSQGRAQDAVKLKAELELRATELAPLLQQRLSTLPGWESRRLEKTAEGTFKVDFSLLRIDSLDSLEGMPVCELSLNGCSSSISQALLESLAKLPLKTLKMKGCNLSRLDFLEGAAVENLVLASNPVSDLAPLKSVPLRRLNLLDTSVGDLSPLAACLHLEEIVLPKSAKNAEVLKGNPALKRISLNEQNNGSPQHSAAEFWKSHAP